MAEDCRAGLAALSPNKGYGDTAGEARIKRSWIPCHAEPSQQLIMQAWDLLQKSASFTEMRTMHAAAFPVLSLLSGLNSQEFT